jgi:hypothetical protein
MRLFLLLLLVLGAAGLAVAATIFRSQGAVRLLKRLRLIAFVYVATIVAIGLWRIWEQGGL